VAQLSRLGHIHTTMPDIHFECPKCKQTLDAPEELATQLIECPTCKKTIEVPARSQRKEVPKPPEPLKPTTTPTPPAPPAVPVPIPPKSPAYQGITSSQANTIIALLVLAFIVFPLLRSFIGAVFPQRWEYEVVAVSDYTFTEDMNKLGSQGWEVVSARRAAGEFTSAKYEMILKRPK
jgi:ribosomal protein L37AE/L43A/nitrate reductase NapE component